MINYKLGRCAQNDLPNFFRSKLTLTKETL